MDRTMPSTDDCSVSQVPGGSIGFPVFPRIRGEAAPAAENRSLYPEANLPRVAIGKPEGTSPATPSVYDHDGEASYGEREQLLKRCALHVAEGLTLRTAHERCHERGIVLRTRGRTRGRTTRE
jgi:hypothetical protein